MRALTLGCLLLSFLSACRSAPEPNEDVVEQYTDDLQVDDLKVGTGDVARVGQRLTVHYDGYFTTGALFDTSRERGPFTFELGAKRVIKGWDRGLVGMRVGGKRRLIIPEHLAYGSKQVGAVPPHSRLIFEIELLGIGP
jgi:FKBP-type peptidyl-prolyl cis-trans isomerase